MKMLSLIVLTLVVAHAHTAAVGSKKNFLFIMADDMRPQLNAYEGPYFPAPNHAPMHTPNLDKLASHSLLLERSYCQFATCSPSRTSMFTGRRPDTTRVWDLKTYWREAGGNFTSFAQYFKDNGYYTTGMGKILHQSNAAGGDDDISWSAPFWRSSARTGYWKYYGQNHTWWPISDAQIAEHGILPDEEIANHAVETLRGLSSGSLGDGKPWLMAVGFRKPHLPFLFPEKYLDYYPLSSIQLPSNPYAPKNMPEIAWHDFGDLRGRPDIAQLNNSGAINETYPDEIVKELRRAYYSAISFTDDMVGRVIDELEALGLAENTVISFTSDHGYHLGEHAIWSKHTNFEFATQIPFLLSVPGLTDNGLRSDALTELVDVFPTLVELAELPEVPMCIPELSKNTTLCTEGSSMVPLLSNPNLLWKPRIFSQYPRNGPKGSHSKAMGYTMRNDRYRYTEWVKFVYEPDFAPDWNTVFGVELYDHNLDPLENNNVAGDSLYADIVERLHGILVKGWPNSLPIDVKK